MVSIGKEQLHKINQGIFSNTKEASLVAVVWHGGRSQLSTSPLRSGPLL
jgi:hypothetical protein